MSERISFVSAFIAFTVLIVVILVGIIRASNDFDRKCGAQAGHASKTVPWLCVGPGGRVIEVNRGEPWPSR